MDNSKIVFLVNDAARAVRAQYEDGTGQAVKTYTLKTLDAALKVGDIAVVQSGTRWGYTVVKVTEVNVDVDFDSNIELKWLVAKVDLAAFERIVEMENAAIAVVQSAELRRKKAELRKTLFADQEAAMDALALARPAGEAVIGEAPPSRPK